MVPEHLPGFWRKRSVTGKCLLFLSISQDSGGRGQATVSPRVCETASGGPVLGFCRKCGLTPRRAGGLGTIHGKNLELAGT